MSLFVQSLFHYPIKSTRGTALKQATVYPYGIEQDRRWLLVNDQNQMITQRKLAAIGALRAEANPATPHRLTLHFQDQTLEVEAAPSLITVNIWEDQTPAWQVDDAVNQTLSAWFGQALKLVYFALEDSHRMVDIDYAGEGFQTAFSDGFPILVITQASLDALSAKWGSTIDVRRFRPNIVVGGDCKAFAEDHWKAIQIGDLTLDLVKPCSRCVIPSLDPDTLKSTENFARFLATERRKDNGKVYFGQNAVVRQAQFKDLQQALGQLMIGQSVALIH